MTLKLLTFSLALLVLLALLSPTNGLVNFRVPPRRRPPIHLITPVTPYPTPSMVDITTWNFTKPSDFASLCLKNELGKSIVDVCQNRAMADYDPYKMKDTKTETWEVCCSLFDEVSCYADNANDFCQPSLAKAVVRYSAKVGSFFSYSICKSIPYYSWKRSCNNETHANEVAQVNKTIHDHPSYQPNFISLPPATGPEAACVRQLRANHSAMMVGGKAYNHFDGCLQQSLSSWDPAHQKLKQSKVRESCCATYQALDCVLASGHSVCASGQQQTDLANYVKSAQVMYDSTICRSVPAEKRAALCKGGPAKGAAFSLAFGSPLALLAFLFARSFFF